MSRDEKTTDAAKPPPRRRGWWRVVLISFAGLTAFWWGYMVLRPVVLPGPWYQDECTFGPITNAEYRDLLAQAKVLAKRDWPNMREAVAERKNADVGELLKNQINKLSRSALSVRYRVAVIHAVMRSNRAHYTGLTLPKEDDPYLWIERAYSKRHQPNSFSTDWTVGFQYRLNLVWFGYYWPLRTNYPVRVDYAVFDSTRTTNSVARRFPAGTYEMLMGSLFSPKHRGHYPIDPDSPPCPPVPTQEWEDRYGAATTGRVENPAPHS